MIQLLLMLLQQQDYTLTNIFFRYLVEVLHPRFILLAQIFHYINFLEFK